MRRFIFIAAILAFFAQTGTGYAARPDEMLSDPALEARARIISQDLRCPVCQNQSIDDSDADLAHDLRVLVRQRLEKGDSDEQVKQYLVDRYGDYVLLDPPFKKTTVALWLGPLALLLCALLAALMFLRARDAPSSQPLSEKEQKRLAALLNEKKSGDKK
jgi:cytochrome c-type biogenesis protein CcmH